MWSIIGVCTMPITRRVCTIAYTTHTLSITFILCVSVVRVSTTNPIKILIVSVLTVHDITTVGWGGTSSGIEDVWVVSMAQNLQ